MILVKKPTVLVAWFADAMNGLAVDYNFHFFPGITKWERAHFILSTACLCVSGIAWISKERET
jgi:hypothetical protein